MAYRLLLGIGFIVLVSLVWMAGRGKTVQRVVQQDQALRKALGVHMIEKRQGDDTGFTVKTTKLIQISEDKFVFNNMDLRTGSGIYLRCGYAEYDARQSVLKVPGELVLELPKEGINALVNGITWNRNKGEAITDNPVKVQGKGIMIRAKKAIFTDNFQRVSFFGGVYAKVSISYISL